MYAIIKTGGKQYRVAQGDIIDVERLFVEAGASVEFEVLFVTNGSDTHIGSSISQCFVTGQAIGEVQGEKVTGLKYKASHNQCRKWGHRQKYTRVKITSIGTSRQSQEG